MIIYLNLKNYTNAINEFEKAGELEPANAAVHFYMGTIYGEIKNYEKAIAAFQKFIKLNPDNVAGYYYIAKILIEMNRFAEAEQELKKITRTYPIRLVRVVFRNIIFLLKTTSNNLFSILYLCFCCFF